MVQLNKKKVTKHEIDIVCGIFVDQNTLKCIDCACSFSIEIYTELGSGLIQCL